MTRPFRPSGRPSAQNANGSSFAPNPTPRGSRHVAPPFNAGRGRSSPLRALSHAGAKRRHDPEALPAPPLGGGGGAMPRAERIAGWAGARFFSPPRPSFFPAHSLSLHPRRRPPFVGCCASAHRQGMPSAARPGRAQATARRRRLTIDPSQRPGASRRRVSRDAFANQQRK